MMDVNSQIQSAELEIRNALQGRPGEALSTLMAAYDARDDGERETFVAAIIGHLVSLNAVFKH